MQHPIPSQSELDDYYERSYRSGMYETFASAELLKDLTAARRIKEVEGKLDLSGNWLDVGASSGRFVKALNDRGIDAEGVELSSTAAELARTKGIKVFEGTIDSLPAGRLYDRISAFDLLEHLIDPIGFLKSAFFRLNMGGALIMTLPNLGSLSRTLMRFRWYFYIPDEHLSYFGSGTLRMTLEKSGFEVISIATTYKPMTFDYAQTQFAEYNPSIYGLLRIASRVMPESARRYPLPLPLGEMMVIARKGVSGNGHGTF